MTGNLSISYKRIEITKIVRQQNLKKQRRDANVTALTVRAVAR